MSATRPLGQILQKNFVYILEDTVLKRWPTDVAVQGSSPARVEISSVISENK